MLQSVQVSLSSALELTEDGMHKLYTECDFFKTYTVVKSLFS